MSSHANCTHEKTKAARAACRAGKGVGPSVGPKPAAKAERADARPESRLETAARKATAYVSGHCSTGNHDRCAGVYATTICTCPCNHAQ